MVSTRVKQVFKASLTSGGGGGGVASASLKSFEQMK